MSLRIFVDDFTALTMYVLLEVCLSSSVLTTLVVYCIEILGFRLTSSLERLRKGPSSLSY